MDAILNEMRQFSVRISQDHDFHCHATDPILGDTAAGHVLIDTAVDDIADEAQAYDDLSLFFGDDDVDPLDVDTENIDRGAVGEEQTTEDALGTSQVADEGLNNLADQIKSPDAITSTSQPTLCPHLAIEPYAHQNNALAKIEIVRDSPLKCILIGDPPGLGRTLPAMMAAVKAKTQGGMFSLIVVPSSCVDQWNEEFGKSFHRDAVRVFILRDPNTSPLELLKYDIVITSYAFVMTEYRKRYNYKHRVSQINQGISGGPLERPSLSIFSDIFLWRVEEGVKCPYLILDEVTAIKNSSSITFCAIEELRKLADCCVMLSGSIIDNTWQDIYAFIQLMNTNPITRKSIFTSTFGSKSVNGKLQPPRGTQFLKLLQLLNSFVVRRPEDVIGLPELEVRTIHFELTPEEASKSSYHFETYTTIMGMKASDRDELQPWKHLTKALQYACHPALVDIMHLARDPRAEDDDGAFADVICKAEDAEKWTAWREQIEKDDSWRSSRVTALIDLFNVSRDIDPACSVLIFDESVYFLDIVEVAFRRMYDPVECLRYDGRVSPEKRTGILQDFEDAAGAKVLLISRAAGGLGLNIPAANIVILCGPWWRSEWETQAIKRAHRLGQTRKVLAFKMVADNCEMESFKAKTRDKKSKDNSRIMEAITRKDGVIPKVYNFT